MRVLKFGGSSLADAKRVRKAIGIILETVRKERLIVVVSAFKGVTNQLLEACRLAESGDRDYQKILQDISLRHRKVFKELGGRKKNSQTRREIKAMLGELSDVLRGVALLHACPPRVLDLAASFGERLSARIISALINESRPACYVDARELIVTDDQFTKAQVLWPQTEEKITAFFKRLSARPRTLAVVTGFIASTESGRTTTLGRDGSDYTAAILGACLKASAIEIWTDVDGVMSADPRAVPNAFVLPEVSYEEAMELSYFGAKVLHSAALSPAVAQKIPILIKNTFNAGASGTLISSRTNNWVGVAKGITSIDSIALLTLRGFSMVGIPGTAERLFRALSGAKVNVILISQASSEHTICFAVASADHLRAQKAIEREFKFEFAAKLALLDVKPSQSIVAVVGDGMKGVPGVAGKIFEALGKNNVNISAIAQGASERNISFVIDSENKIRGLNVIHQAFFEKRKRLNLAIIGVGHIGGALLAQLAKQKSFLEDQLFDVRVVALANSKKFVVDPGGLDLSRWRALLEVSESEMTIHEFAKRIEECKLTNAALVDCTGSREVVDYYSHFVEANLHIITPNKKANVLPWAKYQALIELLKKRQKYFLYEANVGAGLPVISTLQDLIASGDTVKKIEGIFSGTLSFLFNSFDGTKAFSELVQEARERGLTEPDPRDDLSGEDVGRKLLILARQLGWKMDLDHIEVESLAFRDPKRFDNEIAKRLIKARGRGHVLRYVGKLADGKAQAGLIEVPEGHPLAMAQGSDNVIAFTSSRYCVTPLVVQGPGAGADVTATGVFSDILKLLHYLPY